MLKSEIRNRKFDCRESRKYQSNFQPQREKEDTAYSGKRSTQWHEFRPSKWETAPKPSLEAALLEIQ
jgi:hypothetical protein